MNFKPTQQTKDAGITPPLPSQIMAENLWDMNPVKQDSIAQELQSVLYELAPQASQFETERNRRASISIPAGRGMDRSSQFLPQHQLNYFNTVQNRKQSISKSNPKIYALRIASIPGIYFSWNVAKSLIDGCPGAKYKGFFTLEDCQRFIWEQFPGATFTRNSAGDYIMDDPEPVFQLIEEARQKKEKNSGMALKEDSSSFEKSDPDVAHLLELYQNDSRLELTLNAEQQLALNAVSKNENVYITGGRSTGKKVLLAHICNLLATNGKTFHVTSASVLSSFTDKMNFTLGWTGMGKAFGTKRQILGKVRKNTAARKCWADVDVIIITDCSMLSAFMLDVMDFLAKEIRRDQKVFGGIQFILIGDTYGLGPVPTSTVSCPLCGRSLKVMVTPNTTASPYVTCSGEECNHVFLNLWQMRYFEADCFEEGRFTYVKLNTEYDIDPPLQDFLGEIRNNSEDPSQLAGICENISPLVEAGSTIVCPTLEDTTKFNEQGMQDLAGELIKYEARDTVLNNFDFSSRAQQKEGPTEDILGLKVGARVLIIPNEGDELVPGVVIGFTGPSKAEAADIIKRQGKNFKQLEACISEWLNKHSILPQVRLLNSGTVERIDCRVFIVHSCRKAVAWRVQLPLRLAYAIPIYKCHRYKLESLTVPLTMDWIEGQLYSALNMAKTFDALHMDNPTVDFFKLDKKVVEHESKCSPGSPAPQLKVTAQTTGSRESSQAGSKRNSISATTGVGNKRRRSSKASIGAVYEDESAKSPFIMDPQFLRYQAQAQQRRHSYQPLTSYQEQQFAWANAQAVMNANRMGMMGLNVVQPFQGFTNDIQGRTRMPGADMMGAGKPFVFPDPMQMGQYMQQPTVIHHNNGLNQPTMLMPVQEVQQGPAVFPQQSNLQYNGDNSGQTSGVNPNWQWPQQ